eukprot:scpid68251/ scgid16619/ 
MRVVLSGVALDDDIHSHVHVHPHPARDVMSNVSPKHLLITIVIICIAGCNADVQTVSKTSPCSTNCIAISWVTVSEHQEKKAIGPPFPICWLLAGVAARFAGAPYIIAVTTVVFFVLVSVSSQFECSDSKSSDLVQQQQWRQQDQQRQNRHQQKQQVLPTASYS